MNNYTYTFIFFILVVILSACTAPKYVYTPATANLLLLEKKNDLKAAVNFAQAGTILGLNGDSRQSRGVDVQGAYAVSEKAGVKFSAYKKKEYNEANFSYQNQPKNKVNYKKQGIEISGGFYNFSGKQADAKFQLFAGAGTGKFLLSENRFNGFTNDNFYHDMNYFKAFIQPALAVKASNNYHVMLATAISLIKYYNVRTNFTDISDKPLGFIESKPSIFIDFILQNEFSFKSLKGINFQWQAGVTDLITRFSVPGTSGFNNDKYDHNKTWLALGIIADIRALIKH